jgi:predicted lysophospholipase L1 biosynthesis ABC-type transport system permease subunit
MILVLSSSLLGIAIGSALGYTMTIQRALYTELPIPFVLPLGIMEIVGASSVIFAILASFSPIHFLQKMPIVAIMRYVS